MKDKPLVTGIITTYKRQPEYVERAVKSILNQSYSNIEVIIVDDSPDDYIYRAKVKETCESMGPRVRYIQHLRNMGACAARNTGLANSNGEYIGFLDDDDEWLTQKVETMLPLFENEQVGLVYCAVNVVNDITKENFLLNDKFFEGNVLEELLYENFIGSTSFPILKKDVILDVGGFDVNMLASQDYDLWIRVCSKYEVRCTQEILVNYYVHEGEQIGKTSYKRIAGYERLLSKYADYYDKNTIAYCNRKRMLIYDYCNEKEFKKAIVAIQKCIKMQPLKVKTNCRAVFTILKSIFKNITNKERI